MAEGPVGLDRGPDRFDQPDVEWRDRGKRAEEKGT
jgi:hypothetical protein